MPYTQNQKYKPENIYIHAFPPSRWLPRVITSAEVISLLLRVTCIIFERANDTDVNGQAMVVRAIESQKTVVSHLKEARKGFSLLECP